LSRCLAPVVSEKGDAGTESGQFNALEGRFVWDGAGFGTVPAYNKVIDDLADAVDLPNGTTDVEVVAVDSDDSFEANAVGKASHGQTGDFESVFCEESSSDAGLQLPGIGIGFCGILRAWEKERGHRVLRVWGQKTSGSMSRLKMVPGQNTSATTFPYDARNSR
jgi:hypothetical protein